MESMWIMWGMVKYWVESEGEGWEWLEETDGEGMEEADGEGGGD